MTVQSGLFFSLWRAASTDDQVHDPVATHLQGQPARMMTIPEAFEQLRRKTFFEEINVTQLTYRLK